MANIIDDSVDCDIYIGQVSYEDFDIYPFFSNTYLSRNNTQLTFNMPRSAPSYIKKSVSASAFDVKMKLNLTQVDACVNSGEYCSGAATTFCLFRNDSGNIWPGANTNIDCLGILFRQFQYGAGPPSWNFRLVNLIHGWNTTYGTAPEMGWQTYSLNTDFYLHFWREMTPTSSTAWFGLCSDPMCTQYIQGFTNPTSLVLMKADGVTPNLDPYVFFEPFASSGLSGTYNISGMLKDCSVTF